MRIKAILFTLILLLTSCDIGPSGKVYTIGIDPSWYPLNLQGKEDQVTLFSIELLEKIAKEEHLKIAKKTASAGDLLSLLKEEKCDAILSSLQPFLFNEKQLSFSKLYLSTGPVLVMRKNATFSGMDHLQKKEIGYMQGSSDVELLEKESGILIRPYTNTAKAMEKIANGELDGALVDVLVAVSYVKDLYAQSLKIATPPLTDEGLRLITLFEKAPTLMKKFNDGLETLQGDNTYNTLLKKWDLLTPTP